MDHIGFDVHKQASQICIVTEGGEMVEERVRTDAERFAEVLGARPRARILLEASTESEWVARCLEALGHEVVVADPNFACWAAPASTPPRSTPASGRRSSSARWPSTRNRRSSCSAADRRAS